MESVLNLDLLWVGLAVAGAGTLGFSIYFSDTKSATSRAFLFFTSISIFWSVVNFASARVSDPRMALWFIRFVLFFASWHAFSFFVLARQFPSKAAVFSRRVFFVLLSWTAFISILVLTPLVYEAVLAVSPTVETKTGPGIALFGVTVFSFIGAGIWNLTRNYLRSTSTAKRQSEFVLAGMVITFFFLVIFDFIFPAFLNIPTFVPFGGLFLLPFILGVAYAILQYELFNPRVAWFGLLTFLLATATFFDVLLSNSIGLVLYRVGELVLVLLAGIWLIRSMVREFELEAELKEINKRQEGLIHFIGHEVKGFLTKAQGVFSLIHDGELGAVPETMKPFVDRGLQDVQTGVTSVSEILKSSNIKQGTVTFKKEPFDLKEFAAESVEKVRSAAEEKGLNLTFEAQGDTFPMIGDKESIADHVLRNLVENSVNYTPSGDITVSLRKNANTYIFAVKDTGVGITDEDKRKLFTEGGHGSESQKVNVHSTGYGLFIAKQVIEAHGGKVWAESEGAGKGSTFTVELPVQKVASGQ